MDLTQFLVGGAAARPDSLSGMNPDFQSALAAMFAAAPGGLQIKSGFRSPEVQAQLWDQALAKYGSPEAARKWVAPPGRSQHGHGNAADLGYLSPEAKAWAHANASQFGLAFPLSNEPWHIELASARGQQGPVPGTPVPMMAQGATPAPSMAMASVMPAMPGGAAPQPGGMLLGDIAAKFLAGQQARMQERKVEQEAEELRRQALFGGGVASLYG